jgi:hypothetical protein
MLSHDAGHSFLADSFTGFSKIKQDPRTSVNAITRRIELANTPQESYVFDRAIRQRALNPRIEAAACNA